MRNETLWEEMDVIPSMSRNLENKSVEMVWPY
jgi:hypothetical protein